jgi:hypothetical protein
LGYLEFNCIVFVSKLGFGLAHQHLEIAIFRAAGRSRVRGVAQTVRDFEGRYATPSLRSFHLDDWRRVCCKSLMIDSKLSVKASHNAPGGRRLSVGMSLPRPRIRRQQKMMT